MADYCATADLERAAGGSDKLRELADQDADGVADTAVITAARNDAERWMDGYLGRRYSVPLTSPSAVVRRIAAEETIYILRDQRAAVDEHHQRRHDQNLLWLEGVAAGKINPGVDPPPDKSTAIAAKVGDRSSVSGAITRDSLKGFW